MIYILAGMGADRTMYSAPPWRTLTRARFLDWPDHRGETTIAAIADRVIEEARIPDGAVLVGSSLGGIVACEIAVRRPPKELVLIGSATHPDEISRLLAVLHPLARLAPMKFIQAAAGKIPHDLAAMFSRAQPGFIRAACAAIIDWDGLDASRITPLRIHGRRDRVIPPPPAVDLLIEDGGHLLPLTHAKECVSFLRERNVG